MAIAPPKKIPSTNTKFQISFFQSYLKNGILAGKQAAQMCRSDELIPKDLLPNINNTGTVSPINGPATYQGHGCFKRSDIRSVIILVKKGRAMSASPGRGSLQRWSYPFLLKATLVTQVSFFQKDHLNL